jgi:cation diffusion facilitator CzcD-associated flavoprotein CzcO
MELFLRLISNTIATFPLVSDDDFQRAGVVVLTGESLDSYVFPFEPNPNWTHFYAESPEIWQYMKNTAVKYDLDRYVSYNSKLIESIWDEESGKWKVKVEKEGGAIEDECDVLVNAAGFLK